MTKRRFFVGIELDDGARAACAGVLRRLQATGFDARFESVEKLHVTLAFLGNVDPSRAAEIENALERAATACNAFELHVDKLGAFPNEHRPRIVYAGTRAQGAAFRCAASAVRDAYAAIGFAFEQDAVAHVTLARVREPRRPLPAIDVDPFAVRATALALFESFPDRERRTSRYEIVKRATLQVAVPASDCR